MRTIQTLQTAGITFAMIALCATIARAEDPGKYLIFEMLPKAEAAGRTLTTSDLYDRTRFSSSASPVTASAIYDSTSDFTLPDGTECEANPVRVETGSVLHPQLGVSKTEPYVVLPQPTYLDGSGTNYIRHQKIVFPSGVVDSTAAEELSLVARVYFDGSATGSDKNYIFRLACYGYEWSQGSGVDFCFGGAGAYGSGYFGVCFGKDGFKYIKPLIVSSGRWVDVAWTIKRLDTTDGGKNYNYECMAYLTDREQNEGKIFSSVMTNKCSKMTPKASCGIKISAQDQSALATVASAGSNGCRDFKGKIQRLAFYKRALTKDEVVQAMAADSHDIALGVRNGKADEFGASAAESVFDADTMPECELCKTIADGQPLVVKKNLPTNSCHFARFLQFTVLPDAALPSTGVRSYLKISVNDQKIGHVRLEPEGNTYYVCCPADKMKAAVAVVGDVAPVTLKLERVGGTGGTVKIDCLTFGGAWQVGVRDGSNAEFGSAGVYWNYCYHLASGTAKVCSESLYGKQYNMTNQRLYFTLTKEEAENLRLKFTFCGNTTGYWKLQVNDIDYDTSKYVFDPNFTNPYWRFVDYSWTFPVGTFHEGLNWISRVLQTEGGQDWNNNDYFKLETVEAYPCSLHTGPLGISGAMLMVK